MLLKKKNYQTRSIEKNYFTLPNEIFNLDLSSGEISVYSYLLSIEDRKTFKCYPSYKTIGRAVKMSVNTVRKYVESLESKKFIATEPTHLFTKDGMKKNGNLMYNIRPVQEAVEFHQKEFIKKLDEENEKRKVLAKLENAQKQSETLRVS